MVAPPKRDGPAVTKMGACYSVPVTLPQSHHLPPFSRAAPPAWKGFWDSLPSRSNYGIKVVTQSSPHGFRSRPHPSLFAGRRRPPLSSGLYGRFSVFRDFHFRNARSSFRSSALPPGPGRTPILLIRSSLDASITFPFTIPPPLSPFRLFFLEPSTNLLNHNIHDSFPSRPGLVSSSFCGF